jgi:hypothetical protein
MVGLVVYAVLRIARGAGGEPRERRSAVIGAWGRSASSTATPTSLAPQRFPYRPDTFGCP